QVKKDHTGARRVQIRTRMTRTDEDNLTSEGSNASLSRGSEARVSGRGSRAASRVGVPSKARVHDLPSLTVGLLTRSLRDHSHVVFAAVESDSASRLCHHQRPRSLQFIILRRGDRENLISRQIQNLHLTVIT